MESRSASTSRLDILSVFGDFVRSIGLEPEGVLHFGLVRAVRAVKTVEQTLFRSFMRRKERHV